MAENMQWSEGMKSANAVKKIALVLLLVLSVAALAGIWMWIQKPALQLLYSNMTAEDAGAVSTKLREAGIPFDLQGTSVFVPADQVPSLRMQLASSGLPRTGGVGYEIFDRTTMGTSEFVQKVNYRRALEGELSRSIGQLSEVSQARVHLAVPARSVFADRQEQVRASVIVTLRAGKALTSNQVQGIVHLVASSVEGLMPQSITVIDHHGRVLSSPVDEAAKTQMTSSQLDFQRDLESGIEKKIQTMLERVVGPDKAVVRVAGMLDLKRIEETEEIFNPEQQVPRSEHRTEEKGSGASTNPSGAPGVTANVPGGAGSPAGGASSSNNTSKKSELVNFEISKKVSRTIAPIGTIKQLSVAVLIDGITEEQKDAAGKVTGTKYTPRSDEDMKKLEELVKKAMGFSAERKDQLNIVNVPFNRPESPAETPEAIVPSRFMADNWPTIARYAIALILGILILLLVVKPIVTTLLGPPEAYSLPQTVGQLQGAGGPGGRFGAGGFGPGGMMGQGMGGSGMEGEGGGAGAGQGAGAGAGAGTGAGGAGTGAGGGGEGDGFGGAGAGRAGGGPGTGGGGGTIGPDGQPTGAAPPGMTQAEYAMQLARANPKGAAGVVKQWTQEK